MGSQQVAALEKVNSRPSLYEKHNLRRFVDGCEIGQRLFSAVIEDAKILAAKAFDKLPMHIGDNRANINAVHVDSDGGLLRLRTGLPAVAWRGKNQDQK
jgi:hypothetical protein